MAYHPHMRDDYHQTFIKLMEEIQTNLKSIDIDITNEFVVMMVKLVSLDPPNKFLIKQQMVQSELDRMRKLVVNRITGMSPITRNIISMQLHFRVNYYNRDDSIYAHREDQDIKIESLMEEMRNGIPNNLKLHDIWYAKLIGATIIEADMGPATDAVVVKETEAALTSIFPKEDMNLLSSMTNRDRENELYHLMHITIGIRLYSKYQNPSGYGQFIEDLPTVTPQKIEETINAMIEMRSTNIQRLIRYTTIAQPYFLRHVVYRMERRALNSDMVRVRQGLVMVHQILIYLKELTDDLNRERDVCNHFAGAYQVIIEDLHDTVKERSKEKNFGEDGEEETSNVPRTVLYPKFSELNSAWRDLQECQVFVESIASIVQSITDFTKNDLIELDEVAEKILGTSRLPTEREFFSFPVTKLQEDKYAMAKRIDWKEELSVLQMSFSGFCIHSLVRGVGLLVLANPNLGIFNWKNKNYLLSTIQAAMHFRRDPDSYARKAYAIARRWPELIALLNIEKEAFDPITVSDADRSGKTTNVLISTDAQVQTDLHPVETNIVPNYTWNEWELRRRGLILSKIHKCLTHGTQTWSQGLKHNAAVQTYGNKMASIQTKRDVYSEIPLSQFYIYGLRGEHCGVPPHVVEITTDNPCDLKGKATTKIVPPPDIKVDLPYQPQILYHYVIPKPDHENV